MHVFFFRDVRYSMCASNAEAGRPPRSRTGLQSAQHWCSSWRKVPCAPPPPPGGNHPVYKSVGCRGGLGRACNNAIGTGSFNLYTGGVIKCGIVPHFSSTLPALHSPLSFSWRGAARRLCSRLPIRLHTHNQRLLEVIQGYAQTPYHRIWESVGEGKGVRPPLPPSVGGRGSDQPSSPLPLCGPTPTLFLQIALRASSSAQRRPT